MEEKKQEYTSGEGGMPDISQTTWPSVDLRAVATTSCEIGSARDAGNNMGEMEEEENGQQVDGCSSSSSSNIEPGINREDSLPPAERREETPACSPAAGTTVTLPDVKHPAVFSPQGLAEHSPTDVMVNPQDLDAHCPGVTPQYLEEYCPADSIVRPTQNDIDSYCPGVIPPEVNEYCPADTTIETPENLTEYYQGVTLKDTETHCGAIPQVFPQDDVIGNIHGTNITPQDLDEYCPGDAITTQQGLDAYCKATPTDSLHPHDAYASVVPGGQELEKDNVQQVARTKANVTLCRSSLSPQLHVGPNVRKKTVSIADPETYTMFQPVDYYGDSEDANEVFPENTKDVDKHGLSEATGGGGEEDLYNMIGSNVLSPPSWRHNSESDESTYYDTVSSTSSTSALLRRAVVDTNTGRVDPVIPPILDLGSAWGRVHPTEGSASSGFLDIFQRNGSGRALLHKTLEQVKKSLEDLSPTVFPQTEGMPSPQDSANKLKNSYLKNLIVLSLGFMLTYTAFFSMRNLQSSIHDKSGLGLVSMACLYSSFVVGCFFATTIIQQISPQRAIVLSTLGNLAFILVNLHPEFYTMVPATLFLGFAMAVMWTAQGTYITSIGVSYAAISGKKPETVLGLFNGFFIFLLQMAQILGNLISSTVLNIELEYSGKAAARAIHHNHTAVWSNEPGRLGMAHYRHEVDVDMAVVEELGALIYRSMNSTVCGAAYCHSYKIDHGGFNMEPYMLQTLVAIYASLSALATIFTGAFLDKLDVIFHKAKHGVRKQLMAVCSVHRETKAMMLLLPLMTYMGMHEALVYGEVTKAFITCPLGVHMIGYAMMCFGACDSVTAFTCGQLNRYVSRYVFITVGAMLNIGLLAFFYLWIPSEDDIVIIFAAVGGLGACDAIWQTQCCNMCGLLFPPKHREAAFASLRMYEALGFTIAFAYSQFICMDIKILTTGGLLLFAMFNYYVMESIQARQEVGRPRSPLFV